MMRMILCHLKIIYKIFLKKKMNFTFEENIFILFIFFFFSVTSIYLIIQQTRHKHTKNVCFKLGYSNETL